MWRQKWQAYQFAYTLKWTYRKNVFICEPCYPNCLKTLSFMSFAICHQCHWYRWDTLSEFLKELKLPKSYTIWSPVEMIHEKIWSERSRKTVPLSKSDNIWLSKKMPALCRRKRERRRLFIRDRALNYQYLPLRVYQLMTSGCLRDFVFLMVRQWSFICAQEDK